MELTVELLQRFKEMEKLEDDWDSYGSVPITAKAIAKTKEILADIFEEDTEEDGLFISPLPDGGIDMDWDQEHFDGRNSLLVHVHSDGQTVTWALCTDANKDERVYTSGYYEENIMELLTRLSEEKYY